MTFTTRGAPVGPRQQRPAGRPAGRSSMITASTTTRRSRARAPWSTFPAYKKRSTRTMRRRLPLRRSKFLLAASTAVRVAMVPTCTTSTLEVLSPGPRLVGAVNVEKINAQQQSQQQGNAGNGSGTTTNTAQTAQPSSKTNEGNCNGGGSCGQNTSGEELQRMKDGTPKAVIGQFSDPHKGPDVVPDPAEQPPRGPSSASRLQASQRVPSSEGAGTGTSTAAAAGGHQDPDQPRNPTDLAAAASLSTKRTTSKTGGSPPGVDEASTRTSGNEITPGDPLKAAAAGEHQSAGEPPPRCETLTDGQAEGVLCALPNGSTYQGQWKDGKRHGEGVYTWENGARYNGQWVNGKRGGSGDTWADGRTVYVGQYKDDKPHGEGTHTLPDGSTYKGQWKGGKMHGEGVYTWPDGATYDGQWEYGKRDGNGVYKLPDVSTYEGQYKDDKKHGKGVLTWSDGRKYDGEWEYGKKHGSGLYTWADGTTYDGQWQYDNMDGSGVCTWADRSKYDGRWQDGLRHGDGKYTRPGGTTSWEGSWWEDKAGLPHYLNPLPDLGTCTTDGHQWLVPVRFEDCKPWKWGDFSPF